MVTIVDGFMIAKSFLFIALESIVNLLITLDFVCRIKLVGTSKFFRNQGKLRWFNIFDTFVVISCNLLFILAVTAGNTTLYYADETIEEILLVVWSVWQLFRLLFIAKKQRLAKQNA
jgi:hypothetical protein